MTAPNKIDKPARVNLRSMWESALETFGISLIISIVFASLIYIYFSDQNDPFGHFIEAAPDIGTEVLKNSAWGFGVLIPALLGFYAIAAGGQRAADSEIALRNARRVGIAAEFIAGLTVPMLFLAFAATWGNPANLGGLLVTLPAAAAALSLATMLGTFNIFPKMKRLEIAENYSRWAKAKLNVGETQPEDPDQSQGSTWFVVIVTIANAVLIGVIGAAVPLLTTIANLRSSGSALWVDALFDSLKVGGVFLIISGVLTFFSFLQIQARYTNLDRTSVWSSRIMVWITYLYVLIIILAMFILSNWTIGSGLTLVLAGTLVSSDFSAFRIRASRAPDRTERSSKLSKWTVLGTAVGGADLSIKSRLERAEAQIADLKSEDPNPR